eukprot:SM000009S23531  [mRNA]  locus=s9:572888:573676:- [translate_table: standard]
MVELAKEDLKVVRRGTLEEVVDQEVGRRAEGTLEELVGGEVVEVGAQPEDCEGEGRRLEAGVANREVVEVEVEVGAWQQDWEEEDWRAEVMEVAMEEVGRRAKVSEEELEVVERGTQEGLVEEVIEVGVGHCESLEVVEVEVEEKVDWTEVMEVAVKDSKVVKRWTMGVLVEEEEVGLGAQLADCEEEGERLEVMALTEVGVVVRESWEVLGVEVEVGA